MKLTKEVEIHQINKIITNKDKLQTAVMDLPVVEVDRTTTMVLCKTATETESNAIVTVEWEQFPSLVF